MKTKLHLCFMLLIFYSFIPKALATDYYTASATATLAGNTGSVNANWTTNPDGLTGLTTVTIVATDRLVILNGGTATITAGMSIGALTINTGGKIIHNNNASASSFTINGLLTWNGTIKTMQAVSGSNFFNVAGDVIGTTALHDIASNRGVYFGGDGLRTINLNQVSGGIVNSTSVGIILAKNHSLSGNCKWYSPIIYNQNCTLDLAGYNLQVSSINGGNATRLIKSAANSNFTISGGVSPSTIYFDPASNVLNNFTINNDFSTGTTTVVVNASDFAVNNFSKSSGGNTTFNGDLTVNTALNFGVSTGTTYTGTLQVNGNLSLGNNGIMSVQTKGTTVSTQYDQLSVTGNISIGTSTTIKVNTINSYVPPSGSLFNFAKSTGGTITGSFGIIQNPTNFITTVSYPAANTVQCELTKTCSFTVTPDLPLQSSNATVETEIETIIQRFSDSYLGTAAPTVNALNNAVTAYNALNIVANGNTITGNITDYNQTTFLKTFAQQLKFNPNDTATYNKALNTVWLVSDLICKGTLTAEYNQYDFKTFSWPAILIPSIKDNPLVKSLFENLLYRQNQFDYIWEPNINVTSVGHNLDHLGNSGVVTMAYVKWIDSADERFRYMTAFKRQMESFTSYSVGTEDGLKPDGSGFHHWASYPGYMYDLNTAADIIYYLRGTSFQVSSASYLRLRDAFTAQLMIGNDNTVRSVSMSGRNPHIFNTNITKNSFRNLAVAGGSILNTGSSDPAMATLYNHTWPSDPYTPLGNTTAAPFNSGYFQFNHSMAGIYRRNSWVATCKGFNNNMFGAEIFGPSQGAANRFGRYQSYGTVDIMYAGDNPTGNGYDVTTRDWNYYPGATVIRLPWDKLEAEKETQDELQQKRFAGSLSFINKNNDYLKAIQGTYGMFAMDFQQKTGLGWGTVRHTESHNTTFVFKKSVFAFDNMLICLGSNIGNNDSVNTTLTTLYQRKTISGTKDQVIVDSNLLSTGTHENTYADTSNHWIVDNFNTGFYVFSGSGTIKLKKADQQVPQHNQLLSAQNVSVNPVGNYAIGYIDHGLAPSNKGYEYICMPQATTTDMTNLDSQISTGSKPYTVHRKDNIAHIVEYKPTTNANSIFGYAFFATLSGINNTGQLTGADYPCLVMSQYDSIEKTLQIAVNNPDIGYTWRQKTPSISRQINVTIKGTNWEIAQPNANATITGTANGETTIQFTTIDGLPVEITLTRVLTPQTITFNAIATKTTTDPAFNLTATASSGLAVTYTSSNTAVATISGSTVTIVGAGTSTITASQEGNTIYDAATPVAQTLTVNTIINTVADTYVRDGSYATTNFGTATTFTVKKDGTGYSREIFLKFDLNGSNSFEGANLRLNISSANTNVANTTWQIYYVPTDSWTETGITWSNKPASSTLLATINGQSSGWVEWDITNQALAELSGDKTLSLKIVSTVAGSTTDASFNSKEATNTTLRPQLLLTPESLTGRGNSENNLNSKSIESEVKNTTIQVYPNSVEDVLHINLAGNKGSEAHLFDINGRMLLNQKLEGSDTVLDVSKLPVGIYVVKIYAGSEEITVKKVVKK